MNLRYRIYGLKLQSDLALSGAGVRTSAHPASPDLVVTLRTQPKWAKDALLLSATAVLIRPSSIFPDDPIFSVTELDGARSFLLAYGDGTRFVLDAGCTHLWGEPGPGLSFDDLCVYLLGPVMGFVLRERGLSPLHASAVSIQDSAIALVGEAGAGKSTTAAALALRGWPVLCEDVCAFDETDATFDVRPAYPRISLWPDSVAMLCGSFDGLPLIVSGWDKRYLALDGSRASFAADSAPLAAIYFLAARSSADDAPRIESVSPQDALLQLIQDTYMNWLLDRDQRAMEFDMLSRLAQRIPCFRVTPSQDPARLPKLIEMIEAETLRLIASRSYSAVGGIRGNV